MSENILRCFVDLRRNDIEFPFISTMLDADKQSFLNRIVDLLEEESETWTLYSLDNLDAGKRIALEDIELIDNELLQYNEANIFVKEDQTAIICINMDDHILIRVKAQYEDEQTAIHQAKDLAQVLSQGSAYAKDANIGWLTAKPQYAGTGLQLTYVLHLPMLSMMQQIKGNAAKLNAEHRFLLRSQSGTEENNEPTLYYLRNLFTAYGSSANLLQDIQGKLIELTGKEQGLRKKILKFTNRSIYSDQIFRAYGILKYARRLTQTEFLSYWSKLRLGANAGLLPLTTQFVDSLLALTTKAKLIQQSDGILDEHAIHFNRADTVRLALNGGI